MVALDEILHSKEEMMDDSSEPVLQHDDDVRKVDWMIRMELVQTIDAIADATGRSAGSVVDDFLTEVLEKFRSNTVTLHNVRVLEDLD